MDLQDNLFMIPGPVKMHPRVLAAMSVPAMGHRTAPFRAVNKELRRLLQYVFQTRGEVALISGSGTAGLDGVFSTMLRKDDRVVTLANGKFGERLQELAGHYCTLMPIRAPWGQQIPLDSVATALEAGATALAFVHNETSVGCTQDAEALAKLAHKHDALLVIDGITSVGGIDVPTDRWKADAVVFGSQKCIGAPAGLAGVAVSERGYDRLDGSRSYYLDLRKHIDKMRQDDTPFTPAIPLHFAMLEALRLLEDETLPRRLARTALMAQASRAAAAALGVSLFPDERIASDTLTAVRYPPGIDDATFRAQLGEEAGVVIAGGQDSVKGVIFRIAHMGFTSLREVDATYGAVGALLQRHGIAGDVGAAAEAVAPYYTKIAALHKA